MSFARDKPAALLIATLFLLSLVSSSAAAPRGNPWLGLAAGRLGEYRWSVGARRPDGPAAQGSRPPCLLVAAIWRTGPFDYHRSKSRQCAASASLSPSKAPVVADGAAPANGAAPKLTAIGIIAAPAVRRIRVTFGDGSRRTIHLAAISSLGKPDAGLGRFRYAGFAIRGEWCDERLVAKSASGRTLWDSGTDGYPCTDSGPPRFVEG